MGTCDAVAFHANTAAASTERTPPNSVAAMIQESVVMAKAAHYKRTAAKPSSIRSTEDLSLPPDESCHAPRHVVAPVGKKTRRIRIRAEVFAVDLRDARPL